MIERYSASVVDDDGDLRHIIVVVDWDRLVERLGRAAIRNQSGRASEACGAVRARLVTPVSAAAGDARAKEGR